MTSGGIKSDQELNNLVIQIKDLQERLTQLETHALTSDKIKANKIGVGIESILAGISDGDIATIPLTPYHDDSTIVGWSSTTIEDIRYKKIGDLMFVQYVIEGISNATNAHFTLPYAKAIDESASRLIRAKNNSGAWVAGLSVLGNGSKQVNLYSSPNGGGWTASGTKGVQGGFFYWATQ